MQGIMPTTGANGEASVRSAYHCSTLLANWEEERRQFGRPLAQDRDQGVMDGTTTYHTSYRPNGPEAAAAAKPMSSGAAEGPRILLFHHGDIGNIQQYGHAVTELALTDRNKERYTNDEVLDMPGVSTRQSKSKEIRRAYHIPGMESVNGVEANDDEAPPPPSEALMREADFLKTMASSGRSEAAPSEDSTSSAYMPPRLLPLGRAAERERLLTTKNVTIDATAIHLRQNLDAYPLTSSTTIGAYVKSCGNPMYKTNLRVHYAEDDY